MTTTSLAPRLRSEGGTPLPTISTDDVVALLVAIVLAVGMGLLLGLEPTAPAEGPLFVAWLVASALGLAACVAIVRHFRGAPGGTRRLSALGVAVSLPALVASGAVTVVTAASGGERATIALSGAPATIYSEWRPEWTALVTGGPVLTASHHVVAISDPRAVGAYLAVAPMEDLVDSPVVVAAEHDDASETSLERLQEMCDAGSAGSCYTAGARLERADELDDARTAYAAGCDAGSGPACHGAARLSAGELRLRYAHEGCAADHAPSCTLEGTLLHSADSLREARDAFGDACRLRSAAGCGALGTMEFRGRGGSADYAAALEHFAYACGHGGMQSCADLGNAYATGRGTPRDPGVALHYFERACDGGITLACPNADFLRSIGAEPREPGDLPPPGPTP